MRYTVHLKPKAEKDLKSLSPTDLKGVTERLLWMEEDLRGDVKKLSNHFPEYRMRAGNLLRSRTLRLSFTVSCTGAKLTNEHHEHPSTDQIRCAAV